MSRKFIVTIRSATTLDVYGIQDALVGADRDMLDHQHTDVELVEVKAYQPGTTKPGDTTALKYTVIEAC